MAARQSQLNISATLDQQQGPHAADGVGLGAISAADSSKSVLWGVCGLCEAWLIAPQQPPASCSLPTTQQQPSRRAAHKHKQQCRRCCETAPDPPPAFDSVCSGRSSSSSSCCVWSQQHTQQGDQSCRAAHRHKQLIHVTCERQQRCLVSRVCLHSPRCACCASAPFLCLLSYAPLFPPWRLVTYANAHGE